MRKIGDIAQGIDLSEKEDVFYCDLDDQTIEVINEIFGSIKTICTAWRETWQTQDEFNSAKREWFKAFVDARISNMEQIEAGLKKLRLSGDPFVPTVGKFIAWCTPTPDEIGLPSVWLAYKEACENAHPSKTEKDYTHDAVRHAAKLTGSFELSNLPKSQNFPIFERNYEITCRKIINGENVSEVVVPKAIEAPKTQARMSRNNAMEEISKMLGGKFKPIST